MYGGDSKRGRQSQSKHNDAFRKACRKKRWSKEENERLVYAVTEQLKKGPNVKWDKVARLLPNRSHRQCRERWVDHLSPVICWEKWDTKELKLLVTLYREHGTAWIKVAGIMKRRTGRHRSQIQVKNKMNAILRNHASWKYNPNKTSPPTDLERANLEDMRSARRNEARPSNLPDASELVYGGTNLEDVAEDDGDDEDFEPAQPEPQAPARSEKPKRNDPNSNSAVVRKFISSFIRPSLSPESLTRILDHKPSPAPTIPTPPLSCDTDIVPLRAGYMRRFYGTTPPPSTLHWRKSPGLDRLFDRSTASGEAWNACLAELTDAMTSITLRGFSTIPDDAFLGPPYLNDMTMLGSGCFSFKPWTGDVDMYDVAEDANMSVSSSAEDTSVLSEDSLANITSQNIVRPMRVACLIGDGPKVSRTLSDRAVPAEVFR
ncbi:Myb-like domain [Carpediemonas membranifera]|uniref:Myb-like domain n=1 Tax=Carpediemonas membranifera TaxID=201153 RepID=A0A8J6BA83_9EUKA|nr:Myb-like domain [Carpediemonas membranifera]|eukprot:KAG9395972.1 Myb-like domain [Carpediemonas membranifera]